MWDNIMIETVVVRYVIGINETIDMQSCVIN